MNRPVEVSHLWGSTCEVSQGAGGQASWWSLSVSRILSPLLSLSPGCCNSHLSSLHPASPLSSHVKYFGILGRQERSGPLRQHSAWLGWASSFTTSHLPPWEKSWAKGVSLGTKLCHLGGVVMWVK